MSQQDRITYIDLAKGFCIVLVVIYHLAGFYHITLPYSDFWVSFRMPLYFFLSGCFFKEYNGLLDFIKRKTNKLLVPFVFFYTFSSVLIGTYILKCSNSVSLTNFFNALIDDNYPFGAIWFLLCLFEINIIFYLLFLTFKKSRISNSLIIISTFLTGFVGICLGCIHVDIPFNLDSALSSLPFFACGYFAFRKTKMFKENKYDKYLPILIFVSFLIDFLLCSNYSLRKNTFPGIAAFTIYPCGLLGTYGVIMLAKLIKKIPYVSYCGRYSIIILVTHNLLYNVLNRCFMRIPFLAGLDSHSLLIINFFILMASYTLIIPFMKKYFPHVTAQKDLISIHK